MFFPYTEENRKFFISSYWCPFRRPGDWRPVLIPKKIIVFYTQLLVSFSKTWRLEALFYTEENNLFISSYWYLYRKRGVTGVLFEDEEVGGNFYTEENNRFLYPVTGVVFERGNWRPFLELKKIIFLYPKLVSFSKTWSNLCPFEDEEVGGTFYTEENNRFYIQLFVPFSKTRRLDDPFYTEENILFNIQLLVSFSKTWRLEDICYTEENNRFNIQLLVSFSKSWSYWCPFENVEVRGHFLYQENNLFISSYWCLFRRRGGRRRFLIPDSVSKMEPFYQRKFSLSSVP
ncbi:hypothetical protein CEXT_145391, partial [Caerostris extrusa]